MRLYDLYILLERGFTLPLFSVFMRGVLLEYTYLMSNGSPMYKSLTKTKNYSELETHEALSEKSGFSKCNIKTLYKFFINCKTPCDGL